MSGSSKHNKGVRYAVVGLGHFAQTAILPGFGHTARRSVLAHLVSGDRKKRSILSRKYGVPASSYEDFDHLCQSGDIDAVYIALPNSKHADFAIRAAKHGLHVLCEKPLAYTVKEATAMIAACQAADVRLMTAYRLHFEAGNLQAIKAIRSRTIGEARLFISVHTMQVDADNIRTDLSLGGGPLEDIGIYCINAARYLFQADPERVTSFAVHGQDRRFREVPESVSAVMHFPDDRLATFVCGFGSAKTSEYRVIGTKGMLTMDPAYTWHGDLKQKIEVDGQIRNRTFKFRDQIAAEIDYFTGCVIDGKAPEPSGAEGLIDVRIIEALRESYTRNKSISLKLQADERRPQPQQAITRKGGRRPKPIHASAPTRD